MRGHETGSRDDQLSQFQLRLRGHLQLLAVKWQPVCYAYGDKLLPRALYLFDSMLLRFGERERRTRDELEFQTMPLWIVDEANFESLVNGQSFSGWNPAGSVSTYYPWLCYSTGHADMPLLCPAYGTRSTDTHFVVACSGATTCNLNISFSVLASSDPWPPVPHYYPTCPSNDLPVMAYVWPFLAIIFGCSTLVLALFVIKAKQLLCWKPPSQPFQSLPLEDVTTS